MAESKKRKSDGSGSIYFVQNKKSWMADIQWTDNNGNKHRKSVYRLGYAIVLLLYTGMRIGELIALP